jgi:hypothetical protein
VLENTTVNFCEYFKFVSRVWTLKAAVREQLKKLLGD